MYQKFSEENAINKCKDLKLFYVGRHKGGHDVVVSFICEKHKEIGVQEAKWTHFQSAKYACRICAGKYRNTQEFILGTPQLNPNVIIVSEYEGNNEPIDCVCADCGNNWTTIPRSLRNGSGCPECGKKKAGLSRRVPYDIFVKRVYEVNKNVEIIGDYKSLHKDVTCRCKKCGHIFTVNQACNLIYELVQCPFCTTSKAEQELDEIFDKYNIDHIFHYRFNDCKYKKELEFDFALFNNTKLLCLVEYDGEQHYQPIDFAGKGKDWAENQLKLTQTRDNIKNEYCKNKNIVLIRIPYWEKKNLEQYFITEFNKL